MKCTGIPYEGIVSAKEVIAKKPPFQNGWISLDTELPSKGQKVLLYDKMFDNIILWTIGYDPLHLDPDFTHWMPLPEAPK